MGIHIKRVGHIGLLVSDFEQSFRFYTEVLGCTVTFRRKSAKAQRRHSYALTTCTTMWCSAPPLQAWM